MAVIGLNKFPSGNELVLKLADEIISRLEHAIESSGRANLAVSGGSTPKALFMQLSKSSLKWEAVHVYLVDDRKVSPNDERSNERLVRETLLTNKAKQAHFHSLLESYCSSTPLPLSFDVLLLGMGNDGHTASWFPMGDQLDHAIDPTEVADILELSAPNIPESRVTMTIGAVSRSDFIALHIEGHQKLETYNRALLEGDSNEMPVRHLMRAPNLPIHVYWAE